ncbi:hypothetical protein KY284_009000 [Solanum tuberosum]|nr:hypothetical protein KY284_009000 [Solanum tuberosum]
MSKVSILGETVNSDVDPERLPEQWFLMDPNDFAVEILVEYDPKDSSSIILFGGAVLTALWLTTSIVGAIDSVPLFPKLMELVGLGYALWFTSRYLLFKKNRDEFAAKIEDLKQKTLGSRDD